MPSIVTSPLHDLGVDYGDAGLLGQSRSKAKTEAAQAPANKARLTTTSWVAKKVAAPYGERENDESEREKSD